MPEMILLNPKRKSMKKRSRTRRASSRRKTSYKPRRRRVVRARRRTRRNPVMTVTRSRRRRSSVRRVSRRRGVRRNPFGPLKGIVSKDDVMLGVGVAGSSLVTGFVLAKFGDKLPAIGSPAISAAIYGAGIPIAAGLLIGKFLPGQRTLAKGLVLGGVSTAITVGLNKALATVAPTSGAGMFLQDTSPRALGLSNYPSGYSGLTAFQRTNGVNGFQDQPPAFTPAF